MKFDHFAQHVTLTPEDFQFLGYSCWLGILRNDQNQKHFLEMFSYVVAAGPKTEQLSHFCKKAKTYLQERLYVAGLGA